MRPPNTIQFVRTLKGDGANNEGISLYVDQVSRIYYVKKKISSKKVALGAFTREVEIARQIKGHKNLSHIKWFNTERSPCGRSTFGNIWMEYCDLGTMKQWVDRAYSLGCSRLPQDFVIHSMRDISSALGWLHYGKHWQPGMSTAHNVHGWNPVSHGDLHEGNIFLMSTSFSEAYPKVVLADFGESSSSRHVLAARHDQVLGHADRKAQYFQPEEDIRSFGACFALLLGVSSMVYKASLRDRMQLINILRTTGVFGPTVDVLQETCLEAPLCPNAFQVCNGVYRIRRIYHQVHGPDRPLPRALGSHSSPERQPHAPRSTVSTHCHRRERGRFARLSSHQYPIAGGSCGLVHGRCIPRPTARRVLFPAVMRHTTPAANAFFNRRFF